MKNKVHIKLYEWLIFVLTILFFIGYFGMFSVLANYIPKIIIYLILLSVWIIVMKKYIKKGIKTFKKEYFNDAFSIILVIGIASIILSLIFSKIDNSISATNSEPEKIILLNLFSALIFAPIVEELVTRCAIGLFFEKFIEKDIIINVITAIIFSFLHLFKMEFGIVGLIYYGIVYFMLGYTCGYYYRKNNNILLAMLIHFFWNMLMIAGAMLRYIL